MMTLSLTHSLTLTHTHTREVICKVGPDIHCTSFTIFQSCSAYVQSMSQRIVSIKLHQLHDTSLSWCQPSIRPHFTNSPLSPKTLGFHLRTNMLTPTGSVWQSDNQYVHQPFTIHSHHATFHFLIHSPSVLFVFFCAFAESPRCSTLGMLIHLS